MFDPNNSQDFTGIRYLLGLANRNSSPSISCKAVPVAPPLCLVPVEWSTGPQHLSLLSPTELGTHFSLLGPS